MKPETNVNDRKAWVDAFLKPIARTMKECKIHELTIMILDDGKASYFMQREDITNETKTKKSI
jgi:hypothetical protein